MRLKSIKLAGFKSFVDSTHILLPTNLTAIVGPNGCGKSNIIDAVRWVMGESSAKQLRGESLDDVIFNGSTARKPVGQASIELTFDNSDFTLTGQYASYNEIAIRREISRDGQSVYYLNNGRCRRRDITDLFLGTGLGPRSYAIIEQGMISRIIDAKPEELRAYIEEAAGISKYKERRRETELRIQHTQENLARLNDIREELAKQLNHLQRQASAAERFKVLKEEERLLKAQIQALRWRLLDETLIEQRAAIQEQEEELATSMAQQQELDLHLENQRQQHGEISTQHTDAQAQYYQAANEVTRLEQVIQNQQEKRQQWQREYNDIEQNYQFVLQQLTETEQRSEELAQETIELTPQYEEAKNVAEQSKNALAAAEIVLQQWQAEWDSFNQHSAQMAQQIEVEQTRISHLQQRMQNHQQKIGRLQLEQNQYELEFNNLATDDFGDQIQQLQNKHYSVEQQTKDMAQTLGQERSAIQLLNHELDVAKNQMQGLRGQQTSLETLQQVALGQKEEKLMQWLQLHQLGDLPRLAQVLQVEAGWEKAVETVLERYLQAVCVEEITSISSALVDLPETNLSLVTKKNISTNHQHNSYSSLTSKVKAPFVLDHLLAGIYLAENLDVAMSAIENLAAHESFITQDGIWIGKGWIFVAHKSDAKNGILQRERELSVIKQTMDEVKTQIENFQESIATKQQQIHEIEAQREILQKQLADCVAEQADVRAKQQVHQAQVAQIEQRSQRIADELHDYMQQMQQDHESLTEKQLLQEQMQEKQLQQEQKRQELLSSKTQCQSQLDGVRTQAQHEREIAHQLELRSQAATMQLSSARQNVSRFQQQIAEFELRKQSLNESLSSVEEPLIEYAEKLQVSVTEKTTLNEKLTTVRELLANVDIEVKDLDQQRHRTEQVILDKRNALEQLRLSGQANEVRLKGLEEQVTESGFDLPVLITELPTDIVENEWEEKLNFTTRKIDRLGPINLAAIDECVTLDERKVYLDKQCEDLNEALTTLQDVMQKIDEETKNRFNETFNIVNENFQKLFPTLFGGGRASLQLLGDDVLTTGVAVMAQPPGKRNSTIHLLSGGEKALTATAVVFAMFQLNPAPFCMLDEVDAPLDDANVGRFCNLVKQMSEHVQFIFITHNKVTMEMAQQLAGVTMHEAGVSRMVAVDVQEAIALATA